MTSSNYRPSEVTQLVQAAPAAQRMGILQILRQQQWRCRRQWPCPGGHARTIKRRLKKHIHRVYSNLYLLWEAPRAHQLHHCTYQQDVAGHEKPELDDPPPPVFWYVDPQLVGRLALRAVGKRKALLHGTPLVCRGRQGAKAIEAGLRGKPSTGWR